MYCRNCGAECNDNPLVCPKCGCDIHEGDINENETAELDENSEKIEEVHNTEVDSISQAESKLKASVKNRVVSPKIFVIFLSVICGLMIVIIGLISFNIIYKPEYEYCVKQYFPEESHERTGSNFADTAAYTTIDVNEDELNSLGAQGWEIVTSYIETETAWPNFGNSGYVTGLQPNVRPQSLVVILKREK